MTAPPATPAVSANDGSGPRAPAHFVVSRSSGGAPRSARARLTGDAARALARREQERLEVRRERLPRGRRRHRPQPRVEVLEERVRVADVPRGVGGEQQERLARRAPAGAIETPASSNCTRARRAGSPPRPSASAAAGAASDPHEVAVGREVRRAAWSAATPSGTSSPAPRPSSTARPGNGSPLVAEQRPVGQLRRGGAPGAEGDVPPARAAAGELVEHRGARRLGRRAAAELRHGTVAEAVQDHEDRRQPVVRGHRTTPWARRRARNSRRGATVAGGTSRSQSPPGAHRRADLRGRPPLARPGLRLDHPVAGGGEAAGLLRLPGAPAAHVLDGVEGRVALPQLGAAEVERHDDHPRVVLERRQQQLRALPVGERVRVLRGAGGRCPAPGAGSTGPGW